MEIKGKVYQILPLQSGIGQNSGKEWKKQEFVLETEDQYPRKICFQLFGDRVDQFPMAIGENVIVSVDIESREYNGRWYTNVSAWKVDKVSDNPQDMPPVPPAPTADFFPPAGESSNDDLPF